MPLLATFLRINGQLTNVDVEYDTDGTVLSVVEEGPGRELVDELTAAERRVIENAVYWDQFEEGRGRG